MTKNAKQKAILILPLLVGIFLLFYSFGFSADQPDFPKIYIDEGCGGTHVGSQANPYDDLSDINWTTGGDNSIFDYLAGSPTQSPTIYLKKGDTWREQMTIGCSGTATYPIIITSYGSGADPIISGAIDYVGSSWTQLTTTDTATVSTYKDDAYDYNGVYYDSNWWSTIGRYDDDTSGIVFNGIAVPQGATITTAMLTVEAMSTQSGTIYLDIYRILNLIILAIFM